MVCPTAGHFLPGAFEAIVSEFLSRPTVGAISTTGFLSDDFGNTFNHADIVTLLFSSYRPYIPAIFFRLEVLLAVGIERDDWLVDALVLELCIRVATDWEIASLSKTVVHFRNRQNRADGLVHNVVDVIDNTLRVITQVFSRDGFFVGAAETLALECRANQLGILWQEFRSLGDAQIEYQIMPHLTTLVFDLQRQLRNHAPLILRSLHRLFCVRSHNLGYLSQPLQKVLAATARMSGRPSIHIASLVWKTPVWGFWLIRKIIRLTLPTAGHHPAAPSFEAMHADLYAMVAQRFDSRGQIDAALAMWDRASPPHDDSIDSLACQAMLKSPVATEATLAERQISWVRRHLGERPRLSLSPQRRGKIRIAYHCAFMHGDTMRNMMRNVISAHDRERFQIYGYSPYPVSDDIKSVFDVWQRTPGVLSGPEACSDEQFVELVRKDQIDVFVECTGFSAGHRFGAMTLRCAPVQISFLNHTGTSQMPNVDYILADEICVPTNSECLDYYSEKVYRLPGCFFCFDYTSSNEPPVTASPHLRNGHVTFGCFGSGGKIGREIIGIWARVLKRVPGSILRLQNHELSLPGDRRFLASRFREFGISPHRLVIEQGVDRPTLLQAYSQVDISLDTWPYCGGNSIAESLWHGVPVVTYLGDRFSSRYGASLLTAAGCTDLVASTIDDYIDIAAKLASESDRLTWLRQNLRQMSVEFGLGDSRLFARRLENAYVSMLDMLSASS